MICQPCWKASQLRAWPPEAWPEQGGHWFDSWYWNFSFGWVLNFLKRQEINARNKLFWEKYVYEAFTRECESAVDAVGLRQPGCSNFGGFYAPVQKPPVWLDCGKGILCSPQDSHAQVLQMCWWSRQLLPKKIPSCTMTILDENG